MGFLINKNKTVEIILSGCHCESFDWLRVVSLSNQSESLSDEAIYDCDADLIGGTEIASSP